jgi:hypothetical protein
MTNEAMSPLRRRMIEDMTIRKLAPKTQHDYVQRVMNFAAFLGRSPDTASFEDEWKRPPTEAALTPEQGEREQANWSQAQRNKYNQHGTIIHAGDLPHEMPPVICRACQKVVISSQNYKSG